MRLLKLGAGLVLALTLTAGPAAAQYGPTPNPNPTPDLIRRFPAALSDTTVRAGGSTTISGPAGSFAANTLVTARLVRITEGAVPLTLGATTSSSSGSASITVIIPPTTAAGVYFLYLEGTGPDGNPRVLIAALVVTAIPGSAQSARAVSPENERANGNDEPRGTTGLSTGAGGPTVVVPSLGATGSPRAGGSEATTKPPSAVLPAAIQVLQGGLTPSQEAAAVKAVSAGNAQLVVDNDGLEVAQLRATDAPASSAGDSSGSGAPVWAAGGLAVILAGFGLLTLRNRKNARRTS